MATATFQLREKYHIYEFGVAEHVAYCSAAEPHVPILLGGDALLNAFEERGGAACVVCLYEYQDRLRAELDAVNARLDLLEHA